MRLFFYQIILTLAFSPLDSNNFTGSNGNFRRLWFYEWFLLLLCLLFSCLFFIYSIRWLISNSLRCFFFLLYCSKICLPCFMLCVFFLLLLFIKVIFNCYGFGFTCRDNERRQHTQHDINYFVLFRCYFFLFFPLLFFYIVDRE